MRFKAKYNDDLVYGLQAVSAVLEEPPSTVLRKFELGILPCAQVGPLMLGNRRTLLAAKEGGLIRRRPRKAAPGEARKEMEEAV
jgi:hypothetical protein